MTLDLTALENALSRMREALAMLDVPETANNPTLRRLIRTACVKTFEYTYELSWKMMKRYLEMTTESPDEVDQFSYRELIRKAAERDLIDNAERWFSYREERNITSHTYDEVKADEVIAAARKLVGDAERLLSELKKRGGASR